jgi:hypothetical protein
LPAKITAPGRRPVQRRLDSAADDQASRPLTHDAFRRLQRGDRLRDRGSRESTVRATAYLDPETGAYRTVLVAGAHVQVERERFCEGYVVLAD